MGNYTKITNFAAKDSGALDANRLITGTAHDNEYNAISTAISTKADLISPTLVTPNIGVASGTSLALSGAISGAAISGTTGTFSGAISGTTGTFSSTASATQYTSTIATGTAPFVVASTTEVTNLKAATATLATTATTATTCADEIGIGQTWQYLTASRAIDTTYTNSTSKPIEVMVTCELPPGGLENTLIGGTVMSTMYNNTALAIVIRMPVSFIVPPGQTYRISNIAGGVNITAWSELR